MPLITQKAPKEQKISKENKIQKDNKATIKALNKEIKELRQRVLYDDVTNLYTMSTFCEKGLEMLDEDSMAGIIVFSANNLEKILGTYGIDEVDKVRKYIGDSLRRVLTDSYLYGRVHDDLFAIMTCYDEEDELINVVELLCNKITSYENNSKLELTFGICTIDDDSAIEEVVRKAEMVKRTVKSTEIDNNYAFYTEEIEKRLEEDKVMGEQMEYALAHRQFLMYLQPIVNIRTHEIIAAEGLVRWNHPTMGVLSPFKFLPLFEANNFIIKMDHYMWAEAFKIIRHWQDNKLEPIPIHINISAIHFDHPRFVETISGLVKRYKVSASYICLEIPEVIFSEPTQKTGKVLEELKKIGFVICIDNFGSYRSPINFFIDSPVSVIKLDRNFLWRNFQTEKGSTFIRYLYALATEFEMKVVAEGVEDTVQVADLNSMGCEYAQGFFFAKPMNLREFDEFRENTIQNRYTPKLMYPTFDYEDKELLP